MRTFEIGIADGIFEALLIQEFKQQLAYSQERLDMTLNGKLSGCYSWENLEKERTELEKDVTAYKRMLKLYEPWYDTSNT